MNPQKYQHAKAIQGLYELSLMKICARYVMRLKNEGFPSQFLRNQVFSALIKRHQLTKRKQDLRTSQMFFQSGENNLLGKSGRYCGQVNRMTERRT